MKRISLIVFAVLSLLAGAKAQNVDDALRYSQIFYSGTARFNSMGGAFTALGGDISSLNQNPAGLGVFRTSEFTISPLLFNVRSSASYNGKSNDNLYKFNVGQIGIVANMLTKSSGLMSLNFGYSYNKLNNFDQSVNIRGVSNTSSMSDYWAALGNKDGGTYFDDLNGAERIAFDTYVIDTLAGSRGFGYGTAYSNYGDNPPSKYGQRVTRLISNEGSIGEHSFSVGGNYNNKLFFGATVGITKLRYISHFSHSEITDVALPSLFREFTYTDHYEDKGTGYSIKLGAIFKPVEAVRIGVAFHSPTWYKIDEYYYKDITSQFTDGAKYESKNTPSRFNYALATPFRVLVGVGVQVQKHALLSADYEFVDYTSARFSETGDGFDYGPTNSEIKNSLKPTSNIRFGAEYRFNVLYLRGGYGLYGKSFASGEDNASLNYNSIAFGAGFREKNVSIDFGFTNFKYSQKYFLYPVVGNTPLAEVGLNTTRNVFTLTFGYKFGI
jgi:hypothetical protein